MKRVMSLCLASTVLLGFAGMSSPVDAAGATRLEEVSQSSHDRALQDLADRYFSSCFKFNPEWGTALGFHEYDSQLCDWSSRRVADRVAELERFKSELQKISRQGLSPRARLDLSLIEMSVNAKLFELTQEKSFEVNPDHYSSGASSAVYCLLTRDYAPLEDRLKAVTARQNQIPQLLAEARTNLKNPPKIYTEIALEQLPGIIDFFETSVPAKFESIPKGAAREQFESSKQKTVQALKDYQKFVKEDVLPRSGGSFALGSEKYSKKLAYEEMVDTPLDKLLAAGEAELDRLKSEFKRVAAQIDPNKDPAQVFQTIAVEHPKPEELLSSVSGVLSGLKKFCVDKNIVSIPSDDELKVEETPPFMRALTFAAMDMPGSFEKKKLDSFYYVTLPGADWSAERTEEHMRSFCTYDLLNTSVHEAFPGHFVQGLFERQAPSKVARIVAANSNVEGWAHYCEEMVVDEGLSGNDPKLGLAQIHDALLRVCRYIVGIKMHTQGMTMEEGTAFFEREGYQEKANALRETKRGTMDPTYLVYTLGKLQIIALRDDYKAAKGASYSLKDFHDRFLKEGPAPVKLIREILLSGAPVQSADH